MLWKVNPCCHFKHKRWAARHFCRRSGTFTNVSFFCSQLHWYGIDFLNVCLVNRVKMWKGRVRALFEPRGCIMCLVYCTVFIVLKRASAFVSGDYGCLLFEVQCFIYATLFLFLHASTLCLDDVNAFTRLCVSVSDQYLYFFLLKWILHGLSPLRRKHTVQNN